MAVESSNPASYRVNYNRRFAKLAIGLFVFGMIATFLVELNTLGLSSDQSMLWLIPLVICAPAMDAAVMWTSMQGPGRWRQTIGGLLYLFVLAVVGGLASTWSTGFRIDVLLDIDMPMDFLDLTSKVALIKIASLITGIQIIDRNDQQSFRGYRWTIGSWLWLLIAIALYVQTSIARARWFAGMLPTPVGSQGNAGSDIVYSSSDGSWFSSVELLFVLFLISELSQSIFSILLAGWCFSGKRWRLFLIPFLALAVYGFKLLWIYYGMIKVDPMVPVYVYFIDATLSGSIGLLLLFTVLTCLCHVVLAALVLWVGCRWAGNRNLGDLSKLH
jgi:hypothetical protein